MEHQIRLSRKYAQAVLNVFGQSISRDDIAHVEQIISFLKQHKKALFFLRLSRIDVQIKERALDRLFEDLSNKKPFIALVHLLVQENRAHLVYSTLSELVTLYYDMHKVMAFEISTSHSISAESLSRVQQFLARETGNDIIYTYTHDASLIAGIRAQSKTILWEHSIRKQLREIALHMASEG